VEELDEAAGVEEDEDKDEGVGVDEEEDAADVDDVVAADVVVL